MLLPAYKVAAYLERAVASPQLQTFSDFEPIAIDDGSKNGTPKRSRVPSLVASQNDGRQQARGELIARVDGQVG